MTLGIAVFKELTESIALAEGAVHLGVGVAGAEGESRVKPKCEPKELGGERFLVLREGLKKKHPR